MKSEKTAIRLLIVSAAILLAAVLFIDRPATAHVGMKDGDYLVAVYEDERGSDTLYIADTRLGVIGAFGFDNNARTIIMRAARPMADAFIGR